MTIKSIAIENIKGISSRKFELDILPNRPSLLVAPNGFGKSSFAAAFSSLQTNKLSVHDDHNHKSDDSLNSKLVIEFVDNVGVSHTLEANEAHNEISGNLDCFVINNKIKAKGVGRNFGGKTAVSASISVDPVVLIDTIPNRSHFNYSARTERQAFGINGKVLTNIAPYFDELKFISAIGNEYANLDRLSQVRNLGVINQVIEDANNENGTAEVLRQWLQDKKLAELEAIGALNTIANLILESNLGNDSPIEAFLAAIQISNLYHRDKTAFKNACKYNNYKIEKAEYKEMLQAFNTSWCEIIPVEKGRKLVVEFPKAHHISNGQRDVITFVALLYRAQRKLRGLNSILVIDEVFDYLDDANLVSVQYYITKMIDKYKSENRRLYPLILTHLNPYYFKNYAFSKQKTYYLDKRDITPNASMVKLIRNRNEPSIEDDVSKYLFHYHPEEINKREEFRALHLRETWGEADNFDRVVFGELEKYLEGEDFDPFSVCCAVRKKIEDVVYSKIISNDQKQEFIETCRTRVKLEYAERIGVEVPEYFYLLGVIYNDGMHWRDGQDNISPIAAKLENQTIKKLISEVNSE